ncbi:endonuclease/exonuclease/phosphatase family protein [Nonomuraea fuscirosea]|uniref:endonuclease/exonuclease/phosphatase family protein n=1 Tax=Nonomuraea fuscirosea TaxID=1291556 RepID=UPI00342D4155
MGTATVKLATWNIGGGILGESHQKNRDPSLDYHVSILQRHAPDVVCLQEAHDYGGRREGQAEYLARHAGYRHVISFPVSESHLEEDAQLTLGILSRRPLLGAELKWFPNPGLTATGPDGDFWKLHDKGYVVASMDLGDQQLGIVNAHCFPLRRFGARPTEAKFARMWKMLANDLMAIRATLPVLAAMDLNHEPIQDVLMEVLRPGGYVNALESTATTAKGAQQDYIIYDHAVRLLATTVTATRSDHSYCQASFLM